jgi:hypothetical protein
MDKNLPKFLALPIFGDQIKKMNWNQPWPLLAKDRLGDILFLLLMSTGFMAATSTGNDKDPLLLGLIAWITNKYGTQVDVFIKAGLAWVPRGDLPRMYTETCKPMWGKRKANYDQGLRLVEEEDETLALLVCPITTQKLKKVTYDVTFSAVCQLSLFCGIADRVPRVPSGTTRTFHLKVVKKLDPDGPLKELWDQIRNGVTNFANCKDKKKKESFLNLLFYFIYLLTHVIYACAFYGVGCDKDELKPFVKLWEGMNCLSKAFEGWTEINIKLVDEPVSELLIALFILSRVANGQLDDRFPVKEHVVKLDRLLRNILPQYGLNNIGKDMDADELYGCVHRELINMHNAALRERRDSVDAKELHAQHKPVQTNNVELAHAVLACGAMGATPSNVARELNAKSKKGDYKNTSMDVFRMLSKELLCLRPLIRKEEHMKPPNKFGPKLADRYFCVKKNRVG